MLRKNKDFQSCSKRNNYYIIRTPNPHHYSNLMASSSMKDESNAVTWWYHSSSSTNDQSNVVVIKACRGEKDRTRKSPKHGSVEEGRKSWGIPTIDACHLEVVHRLQFASQADWWRVRVDVFSRDEMIVAIYGVCHIWRSAAEGCSKIPQFPSVSCWSWSRTICFSWELFCKGGTEETSKAPRLIT
jgi:hypothetical protein